MSMSIQTQGQQYAGFSQDAAAYASRDRVAVYDVPDGVPEYLASARPSISAGLLNTRHAMGIAISDPHGPYGSGIDGYARPSEPEGYDPEGDAAYAAEHGFDQEPPEDPYAGHQQGIPVQPLHQFQEERAGTPLAPEPPGHFNQARRRTADDGGPEFGTFNENLYSPADKLDPRSQLLGAEPERWLTALAVPPAQPAPPAAPVWLGHTYVPGHRVGMPWRDGVIPGTITHLEGYNVGVRWDDGQHSVEEPSGIQPLH